MSGAAPASATSSSRHDAAVSLAIALPAVSYGALLKFTRIALVDAPLSASFSDALFYLGCTCACFAILRASGSWFRAAVIGSQLVTLAWLVLVTACHHFFLETQTPLTYPMFALAIARAQETAVFATEVPRSTLFGFSFVGLALLALPHLVARRAARAPRPSFAWIATAIAILSLFAAIAVPPPPGVERRFAREPTLVMAATSRIEPDEVTVLANLRPTGPRRLLSALPEEPTNVVVVVLESTGARGTSLYPPRLPTTPFLVELSQRATVVDDVFSIIPHTSKALVAILCGVEPRIGVRITESMSVGIPGRCLASLLHEVGYETSFFQSAKPDFEDRPRLVRNMGYGRFTSLEDMDTEGFLRANYFGYEDEVMLPRSEEWLDARDPNRPFFATYLTVAPHHAYLPLTTHGYLELDEDEARNAWLNAIHHEDVFLRRLFAQYEARGLLEDTLFVIVGDHGDGFGEHGRSVHNAVIWNEGVHVPLVIVDPRDPTERRFRGPFSQLDIAPTILTRLGFGQAARRYLGRAIRGDAATDRVVRSSCYSRKMCAARVEGRFKYIHHFGERDDEYFNLARDPFELSNQIDTLTAPVQARYRDDLVSWSSIVNATHEGGVRRAVDPFVSREAVTVSRPNPGELAFPGDAPTIRLLGVDLHRERATRGGVIPVAYTFEVLGRPPDGVKLFLHAHSRLGDRRNLDHVPVNHLYPVDEWREGEFVRDVHGLYLPRHWNADHVALRLGFYRGDERMLVVGDPERSSLDVIELPVDDPIPMIADPAPTVLVPQEAPRRDRREETRTRRAPRSPTR